MHVTGLGQCSWDYLAPVDAYPEADTKKEVLQWREQGGGPVATALVALSRLGVECLFQGLTGDDDAGEKIRRSLLDDRVDVGGLLSRHNASSQKAFIAIEEGSGRRTIFWKRPSGPPLKAEELGGNFPGETDFLLLDGLMTEVSYHAAEKAREKGVPVMLDAGSPRPGLSELARRCDYLVASAAFAKGLGWSLEADALKSERDRLGVKVLTITCGEEGSLTVDEDRFLAVPAFAVKTLDTTGAGDVFHGGYIYGLLRKWGLRDIIIFASALAAIKCTSLGGRAGIPNLDGVTDFLKGRGISLPD